MICYICSNPATNSIRIEDNITVSYCDLHRSEATIGISEYVLKGTLDRLMSYKDMYISEYTVAGKEEFIKCKKIIDYMENYDSSVTEQSI